MADHRWMKFWPADWQSDASLRMSGLAARGLWIECIAIMHTADPYGHLLINGKQPTAKQLASIVGSNEREVTKLLTELEEAGVFSRTAEGVIFSRRMVRDNERSEGGRAAIAKRWANKGNDQDPTSDPDSGPNRSGSDNGGQGAATKAAKPASENETTLLIGENAGATKNASFEEKQASSASDPNRGPRSLEAEAEAEAEEGRTLASLGATAEPPPPADARTALWTEGLARLRRLTGASDRSARAMLGRLCRDARDDCALVSCLLFEAERDRPGDPSAWLVAAIRSRTAGWLNEPKSKMGWMLDS